MVAHRARGLDRVGAPGRRSLLRGGSRGQVDQPPDASSNAKPSHPGPEDLESKPVRRRRVSPSPAAHPRAAATAPRRDPRPTRWRLGPGTRTWSRHSGGCTYGECSSIDGWVRGIAVVIASRIMALGEAGDVHSPGEGDWCPASRTAFAVPERAGYVADEQEFKVPQEAQRQPDRIEGGR